MLGLRQDAVAVAPDDGHRGRDAVEVARACGLERRRPGSAEHGGRANARHRGWLVGADTREPSTIMSRSAARRNAAERPSRALTRAKRSGRAVVEPELPRRCAVLLGRAPSSVGAAGRDRGDRPRAAAHTELERELPAEREAGDVRPLPADLVEHLLEAVGESDRQAASSTSGPPVWPGRVGAKTSNCSSSSRGTGPHARQVAVKPWISSSGGPLPAAVSGRRSAITARPCSGRCPGRRSASPPPSRSRRRPWRRTRTCRPSDRDDVRAIEMTLDAELPGDLGHDPAPRARRRG